jgi:hypothetical protein
MDSYTYQRYNSDNVDQYGNNGENLDQTMLVPG